MESGPTPPSDSRPPSSSAGPSPESSSVRRREARRRKRLWIYGVVGLLIILGAGWIFVLPAVRSMRARQYADEAMGLMRRQNYEQALAKVIAALQFAPRDPNVIRTAATLCAETGSPNGLRYFESLVSMGAASTEDRKNYARLALSLKRIDIARRELTLLLKANPTNLECLHLLAQQQQEARDLGGATRTASYALSLQPNDPKTQLLYGSLLMRNQTNTVRAIGRRTLWGLALGDGSYADAATELLMTSRELTDSETRLLIRDFRTRKDARPIDYLRAQELQLRLEPGRTNELVREMFDQLSSTNSGVDLLSLLGRWALEKNQPELVLDRISPEVARTNGSLSALRGFALVQAKRWNELTPLLDDRDSTMDPVIRNLLRGEMALALGKRSEAEVAFRAASEQPKSSVERIMLVARTAEAAGFPLIAVNSYQRLFGFPGQSVSAALEALRVLGPVDDMALVRDTLKKLNELLPGEDTVAAERAWAELLMNSRLKESRAVAERLHQSQPGEVQWRFLLGLARLRENRAPEAMALLEPEIPNWDRLKPRWQVVLIAALGANQQREAARSFASRLDLKTMRSVERELVKSYLPD